MAKAPDRKARIDTAVEEEPVDPIRDDPLPESSDDLQAFMAGQMLANALPNPPKMKGFHLFWGSTTNQYTPVQWYLRLGYVPVRPDEVPTMDVTGLKPHSGQFEGFVCCNEMVLLKIPDTVYQKIMRKFHHDDPNNEAERLRVNVDMLKDEVGEDSKGTPLVREEGDGMASIVDRRVRAPKPFE